VIFLISRLIYGFFDYREFLSYKKMIRADYWYFVNPFVDWSIFWIVFIFEIVIELSVIIHLVF
jgi:hypothetical protein